MKLRHVAALVLVGWCLVMPPALRAAGDSIAVPGTADIEPRWYLMRPPIVPTSPHSDFSVGDPTTPISRWMIDRAFPTQAECDAERSKFPSGDWDRCISTDDLAHAKAINTPGWLLITAPHDDAAAPLSQWVAAKTRAEGTPYTINFPSKDACERYRPCLYLLCIPSYSVVRQPGIFERWFHLRERWRRRRMSLTSRCVPDDDPRLKGK